MKHLNKGLLLLLIFSLSLTAAEKVAAVIKIKGNVMVRPAAEKLYTQSYVGQILYDGDWLKTNGDEFAAIVFMDGSQLKIRELTELEIRAQQVSQSVQNTDLYLTQGEVWTKVQKQKGEFKIQTPVSVASVKGTEFDLLYDQVENISDLFVISGSVEFSNELGTILAREMTMSRIEPQQKPQRVSKLKKSEIPGWKDDIEPEWGFHVVPEKQGKIPAGQPVNVTVQVRDLSSSKTANQFSGKMTIVSDSPSMIVGVSSVALKDQTEIPISNGNGTFVIKGLNPGDFGCTLSMDKAESKKVMFEFDRTVEQKKKIARDVEKLGTSSKIQKIGELSENRTLETAKISGAGETVNDVLNKVDKGEYEVLDIIQVENPDGTISLRILVEPK
ncbi:MAG: FecR family protein [Fidelibacterota bacterium]